MLKKLITSSTRIRHVYGLLNSTLVGTRLRNTLNRKREILDPAVSDILDAALSQTMRDYYESVFARHAFYRDALKKFDDYDAVLSSVIPVSSLDCGLNKPARLAHRTLVSWVYYTYPFNLWAFPLELSARVWLATECLSGSRSPAGRAVKLMSFVWPPHWRQPSRPATISFTGVILRAAPDRGNSVPCAAHSDISTACQK